MTPCAPRFLAVMPCAAQAHTTIPFTCPLRLPWTQVTLEMVRDMAHTRVTLVPDAEAMAAIKFKAGEHLLERSPPVRLVAELPAAAAQQSAGSQALQVACHARAGIQVLQHKPIKELWQTRVPIDVSRLYSVSVDFNGHFLLRG